MRDRPCPLCRTGRLRQSPWLRVFQCDECNVGTVIEDAPRRIACVVPFCRHTRGDRKGAPLTRTTEWLCEDHWKLVPIRLKRRRAKLRRMEKRTSDPARLERIDRVDRRAWEACKKNAIEGAAGI